MNIAGRKIGRGHSPFIVAELSANHNGKIENAFALIDAARESGANAAKIQVYSPQSMTIDCDGPDFVIGGPTWNGRKLWDLYSEGATPIEWLAPLFAHAKNTGITLFASAFDLAGVDELARLHCPAYKIASFEIGYTHLLQRIANTEMPVIISTGMANVMDIVRALDILRGCEVALLHCVSAYPTPLKHCNLARIKELGSVFHRPVGFSDHTIGIDAAIAAIGAGAHIIEKHLTLSHDTLDASFSLLPQAFKHMAEACRDVGQSLQYPPKDIEGESRKLRRSLFVVADIAMNEPLTMHNIACIRPGAGLAPDRFDSILKRRAAVTLKRGTPLREEHLK